MKPLAAALLEELRGDPVVAVEFVALLRPHLPRTDPDDPPAYTVATLSARIGIPEKTIRAEIRAGRLVAELRGRRYVISAAAVERWLAPAPRVRHHKGVCGSARRSRTGPLVQALARLDDGA